MKFDPGLTDCDKKIKDKKVLKKFFEKRKKKSKKWNLYFLNNILSIIKIWKCLTEQLATRVF